MSGLIPCKVCGKEIAREAKVCPHCGAATPKRRNWVALAVIGFVVLLIFASHRPDQGSTPTSTPNPTSTVVGTEETQPLQTQPLPTDEAAFIAAIREKRNAYNVAPNDMAKGGVRNERKLALCENLASPHVDGWLGEISTLSSNSEGKGVLEIKLDTDLHVQTWNNAVSDIGSGTLIEPQSDLFKKLSGLSVGQTIKFAGDFISDDTDCVREASLTQAGSMTDPSFIMRFTGIEVP